MSSSLLSKTIEDKRCLWLERTNQYVVLEQETFTVAEKLIKGELPKTIATHLETILTVPFEAALEFVKELEDQILNSSTKGQEKVLTIYQILQFQVILRLQQPIKLTIHL